MAVVKALTAERMLAIEASSVISGTVDANGDLILTKHDGTTINAGRALGIKGDQGDPGMPAGTVSMWTASTVPDGWMEADGRLISRTDYPDLFAVIGTRYGTGDGATTYALPDLRGRVVVGQDPADVTFDSIDAFGGEKEHILSVAEMPAHNHNFVYNGGNYNGWPLLGNETSDLHVGFAAGDKWSPERIINLSQTGSNAPHNNLQPYRVLKYIIKVVGGMGTLTPTVETSLSGRMAIAEEDILSLEQSVVDLRTAPYFSASMNTKQTLSGTTVWAKLTFASTTSHVINRGNHYDPALSRFVAPVDGLYEFAYSVTPATSTGGPGFKLYKNGAPAFPEKYDILGYGVAYNTVGTTRGLALLAGDYVEVWWANLNNTTVTVDGVYGGWFTGKLV